MSRPAIAHASTRSLTRARPWGQLLELEVNGKHYISNLDDCNTPVSPMLPGGGV